MSLTPLSQILSYIHEKKMCVCLPLCRGAYIGAGDIAWHCGDPCKNMAVLAVQAPQSKQTHQCCHVRGVMVWMGMLTDSDVHKTCFKHMNQQLHNVHFKTIQL